MGGVISFFKEAYYRISTVLYALKCVYYLPPQTVERFLNSYKLFDMDKVTDDSEHFIADYYAVLNHLCAVGQVEKMYIPPIMDMKAGILANQTLFERQMMKDLDIHPGQHVLDVGCGRGRIAAHVARETKAKVDGINIDAEQLRHARSYAERSGLKEQLNFTNQSYNDPFPFENQTFDALYNVQALTYAKDYDALFKEMYRVMKPGAKASFLDWFVYDKLDLSNPDHKRLMSQVKPLIGAVRDPTPKEFCDALERSGFKILKNANASIDGFQYPLIDEADRYFNIIRSIVEFLATWRIIPSHLKLLFDRLTKDGQAFVEGDKMGLYSSVHQIIAQKPK
jgi:sterol 24-C-methyltransferase